MPTIEVDEATKRIVSFAARMSTLSEGAIIRRLIEASDLSAEVSPTTAPADPEGVPIHADYSGRRVHARYFEPARVVISDQPFAGESFKSPTAAARAVVRFYNPGVNDNRNGWLFWQVGSDSGSRAPLQSIRPGLTRPGRGSLAGRLEASPDWDSAEVNEGIADDFGCAP